jgi:predicted permease
VERDWHQVHAAPANVEDWRTRLTSFAGIAFLNDFTSEMPLGGGREAGQVVVAQVSGNLFEVLGAAPLIGRTFRDSETYEDGRALLSHRVWQQQFSGDPSIVGRTIRLDGKPHEVVGVMGADFDFAITKADVWTTIPFLARRRGTPWFRRAHLVRPIGRLAPGATFDQARAELDAVALDLEREYPDLNKSMRAGLTPLKTFLVGDDRRTTLVLLLGAVGLLQLIACANVANLTLGRAVGRRSELALRAALGAGRGRLIRQLLTESAMLAAGGTLLGLALGFAGLEGIASMSPPELEGLVFRADWRLVLFVVGLGAASALIFGAWPAWRASRVDASGALADSTRTTSGGRRRTFATNVLVAGEIAIAVLLVVSAGLMVRSLDQMRRVPIGADTSNVLTFRIAPPTGTFTTDDARAAFAAQLEERIASLPGVRAVGVGRGLPLTGYAWSSDFTIDGWRPDQFGIDVRHREATAGYFTALGVPVLQGRLFERADVGPDRPYPVLVNRAFAERYFPGSSPVGRRVTFDRVPEAGSHWYPIVGVVENERKVLTMEPEPEIIADLASDPPGVFTYVVKTAVPPLSLTAAIRAEVASLDPETPLMEARTMDAVAREARAPERFVMLLLVVFAIAALVLASVGVYGVASQAARARTREVGIRLALGAPGASIVRGLAARGARFIALGIAAGVAGAVAGGHLLASLLFRVDPRDPLTLGAVTIVIGAVAMASTVWPTWKATRIDPVSVLRR